MGTNVRVVRLNATDVERRTDNLRAFKQLVIASEPSYPNIGTWLTDRVLEGIKTEERVAFVGFANETPAISAVVKRGRESKFCHLKIASDLQDENLGEMFFAMMAVEVRRFAREVHFTLPESLWSEKRRFFESFGFESAVLAAHQYRHGEDELRCSAMFDSVWSATRSKLPKLSRLFSSAGYRLDIPLLMSIRPRFAEAIFAGSKRFELRRRFSQSWTGVRAAILGTRPLNSLMGEVTICSVQRAPVNDAWKYFGGDLSCTKREFDAYVNGVDSVYVLGLDDVTPYVSPVPVSQLAHILNADLHAPQSYFRLDQSLAWRDAVSIAAILHGALAETRKVLPSGARRVTLPDETMPLFAAG